MTYLRQFGGKLTEELARRYGASPHWNGKRFANPVRTGVDLRLSDLPKMLYERFCTNTAREPKDLLTFPEPDLAAFERADGPQLIWFGHSAVLLRMAGRTVFIDPMMGADASPIAPFRTRRFTGSLLHILHRLIKVDLVLLSHDHYDHLDMESIDALLPKTERFITALGVGRHLAAWGCPAEKITELDWWDEVKVDGLRITFTQSRHASGRAVRDQSGTLWGGFVIDDGSTRIWFSGDGGYGTHFKEVGARLGPFDLGLMECGQYNELWSTIHMMPEESAQAAADAGVKRIIPVHWAGFALAMHDWTEPVERTMAKAQELSIPVSTPGIGEVVPATGEEIGGGAWWR